MNENIKIIQINKDDISCISEIAKLEKNIFHDSWTEEQLKDMIKNNINYIYALFVDNVLLGYYCAQLLLGEGELLRIAVSPENRTHGLGNRMMKHFDEIAILEKCEKLFLEVNTKNDAALSLYLKNNYEIISYRNDYYGKGENAAIMMKNTKKEPQ